MMKPYIYLTLYFIFATIANCYANADYESSEYGGSLENEDDDPLEIEAAHLDFDSMTIIVRQGKQLMASCVFAREDIGDISDLKWNKEGGKAIDGESSPSVFTIGMLEHETKHKKKNLHFTAIHKRDEGNYVCNARSLGGKKYTKSISIIVLDDISWNDSSHAAGALVGEPLIIDCGVHRGGEKDPHIEITDGNGEPLQEDRFTIAGNEITIEKLDKEFDGQIISCVHIELVSKGKDEDYPVVDRKDVRIDVWHKPEFLAESVDQYTIIDDKPRTAVLQCNVTSSNPPTNHFTFYRGTEELVDSNKYELIREPQQQAAKLKIFNVNEDDLDEYSCEVNNGKAKSHQIIHLKEASPPTEPKVSLHKVKKHGIVWKIDSNENEDELPVEKIEIIYMRKIIVDREQGLNEHEIDDKIWTEHGNKQTRAKSKNNLYEIPGLLQASQYIFKFRQISEAGEGESVVLTASTSDDGILKEESSASCTIVVSLIWAFFTFTIYLS